MKLQFKRQEELIENLQSYITHFSPEADCEADWHLAAPGMAGSFINQELAPGISASFINANLEESLNLNSRFIQKGMVEIGVNLDGLMESTIKGSRQSLNSYPGQSFISYAGGELDMSSRIAPKSRFKRIEVHFTPEAFDDLCADADCCLPEKLKPYKADRLMGCQQCCSVLPSYLKDMSQSFASLPRQNGNRGELKEICLELSGGILRHLCGGMQSSGAVLSSDDIENIRRARRILSENVESPPSLKELARITGLNDYKLKAGFRQAYGSTYHRTLTELRLEKARELLWIRAISISEIALSTGYGNLGDFGIAFKKRYGLSPREMRQSLRKYTPNNAGRKANESQPHGFGSI